MYYFLKMKDDSLKIMYTNAKIECPDCLLKQTLSLLLKQTTSFLI